ncbi:MAG TPA: (2Fe-2S)-binding protein [Hyphomicrobiaceae bacterium]|nr:(2Fe-2S)-binding protein [Hyphomicrobiaceae bacterium]
MFRRLPDGKTGTIALTIDGAMVIARAGDSVAAALLLAGLDHCRETPVKGSRRQPYCMMGVCFDCLVTIDGVANRQACLIPVREGMKVERQIGARDIAAPSTGSTEGRA